MKYAFIAAEKAWPVEVQCGVLGVSRSGYYAWKGRPAPKRVRADVKLRLEIAASHKRSRGTYGSRRILADLRAQGIRPGKKRVERLMREGGMAAKRKRRFRRTTDSNHTQPTAPNVLERPRRRGRIHPHSLARTNSMTGIGGSAAGPDPRPGARCVVDRASSPLGAR